MHSNETRRFGRRMVQVEEYARKTIADEGRAPSYGMICYKLGIGTRTEVHRIVCRLEKNGRLDRVGNGRVRRIRLKVN